MSAAKIGAGSRAFGGPRGLTTLQKGLVWGGCIVLAVLVLVHAGLIGMGRWQGDEYLTLALYRRYGLPALLRTVTGWSPRPVSELVVWLYARAVNSVGRPLITACLAVLWMTLVASALVTIRWQAPLAVLSHRLMIALSLLAMFLLGHPIAEMFFWPVGAAAYMLTLSAVTLEFGLLLDRNVTTPTTIIVDAGTLVVAAGSSEVGALFTAIMCLLRLSRLRQRNTSRLLFICVVLPLLVALFALITVAIGRAGHMEMAPPTQSYLHRPLASLLAAVPVFLLETIKLSDNAASVNTILLGLAIKLLFFLGVRWCWSYQRGSSVQGILDFIYALLLTNYILLSASYFQFGFLCCERHDTLRQCLIILALAALAMRSVEWSAPGCRATYLAPLPLLVAALIPFSWRMTDLTHDYALYRYAITARAETWRSGKQPGNVSMVLMLPPEGHLVHAIVGFPPGQYSLQSNDEWWVKGVLWFFDKRELEVRALP
jgi:hypothetical protein